MSEQTPNAAIALPPVHLQVHGKLIRGSDRHGPIRPGTEHRVTGRSAGFPDWLRRYCAPEAFFKHWNGITGVDAGRFDGGAFVYRPLRLKIGGSVKFVALFARIEARSEGGKGNPGRRYTHCAALTVEDHWQPELIGWAAKLLFREGEDGRCLGDPNLERDPDRLALPLPPLGPETLPELPSEGYPGWRAETEDPGEHFALRLHCQSRLAFDDPVACGLAVGRDLAANDLASEGRWLSFGLGVRATAIGRHTGFALIADDREAEGEESIVVRFSDSHEYASPELFGEEFDWSRATAVVVPKPAPRVPPVRGTREGKVGRPACDAGPGSQGGAGGRQTGEGMADNQCHDQGIRTAGVPLETDRAGDARPFGGLTDDLVYFDPEFGSVVKNFSLEKIDRNRDIFYREIKIAYDPKSNDGMSNSYKNLILSYIELIDFLIIFSLKRNPNKIVEYILVIFQVDQIQKLDIDSSNRGSIAAQIFGLIWDYHTDRHGPQAYHNTIADLCERERQAAAAAGEKAPHQEPYIEALFEVVRDIITPKPGPKAFDPERKPQHRALFEQWRGYVKQVLDGQAQQEQPAGPCGREPPGNTMDLA